MKPPPSMPPRPSSLPKGEGKEKELAAAIKSGNLERAGHLARSLGNPRYAARLFAEGGHHYQAAVCLYEAGEREESLQSFLRVNKTDPRYRRAAVHATRISCELGVLSGPLDRFVDSFLAGRPESPAEIHAVYQLGVLYQANELFDHAREAFALVLLALPGYEDVQQRLAAIEPVLKNPALYRAMIRQDAASWRPPRSPETVRSVIPSAPSVAPPKVSSPPSASLASLEGLSPPAGGKGADDPSDEPRLEIPPGTRLAGRYRVEEEIGRGGMGVVYRAVDEELDEAVALKLFGARLDFENLVQRFKQELSICRALAHPNIVRLHDIGAHGGRKFITMELLAGASLKHLAQNRLAANLVVPLLEQACAGVGAAHAQGVIHRDVKPDNLFVTTDGVVKLMDFGLAKRLAGAVADNAAEMTVAGFIGGSPAYMAPEQITDFANVGFAADIYSLGVIVYELFTGVMPFRHKDRAKVFEMHLKATPRPPSSIDPMLPRGVDEIVGRCLAKDPGQRYPSAEALGRALASLGERP